MNFLVDTNIATRLAEPGHAMHQAALDAVKLLVAQGHKLYIVPQTRYEFWVVCTRPTSVNGMGRTAAEAVAELATLKALFQWLDETAAVFGVWEQLVSSTPVVGKNAHDARLVAAMMVHGLTHILTFNAQDFRQYVGIMVVTPADVMTSGTARP
jgi:predicted nucleic acid-binding protein